MVFISEQVFEKPIGIAADGFQQALSLFHQAAARVPAYKDFLSKHSIHPEMIRIVSDFTSVPTTDKVNYFSQYTLEELSWNGTLDGANSISTSSGSTGKPFFWPQGNVQNEDKGAIFKDIYENIFNTRTGRTLVIDSFALGTWIAGLEFYNAALWTAAQGNSIVTVTPGIDKAEVINQIQKLARSFDRIIIGGYPPFVKDILEHGIRNGIDWTSFDTRLFLGGEAFSVLWEKKILSLIGKSDACDAIVNVYGMSECGIVGNSTPLTSLVRASNIKEKKSDVLPHSENVMGIYQYNPHSRYFEEGETSLLLTANAGLPLIRYNTRDQGGIIQYDEIQKNETILNEAKIRGIDISKWQSPMVYLHGRKDLSISFYALNVYVENIKFALERSRFSDRHSGLFTMNVEYDENLNQQLHLAIECAEGIEELTQHGIELAEEIQKNIMLVNSEYAKLYAMLGERTNPRIRLVPFGKIDTIPGRKHKWVQR
jgi:phenylacetate-CoA ligase